ncbi:MAG TPA: hypothetical protein DF383_02675, partial [Deltaproteobacteria bacterium]|nr:hypothetical protein [Deltaproteobacteria bacterium]
MDLSFLIPGKIRRQVLQYFVENPDVQVHIRGLARELGASPQQIYQELLNMEGWGLLFSSSQGNQRVFRVNKKFPLLPPIEDLFRSLKEENSRSYDIVQTFDLKE